MFLKTICLFPCYNNLFAAQIVVFQKEYPLRPLNLILSSFLALYLLIIPLPIRTLYVPKIEDKVLNIPNQEKEPSSVEKPKNIPTKKVSEKWLEKEIFHRAKK